jgi:hypothetical protein
MSDETPTLDLRFFADLGVKLNSTLDKVTTSLATFNRLQEYTPVDYQVAAAGVIPVSGTLLLPLGSPDQGTYWQVQQCVAGGADANTVTPGTGALYVSGSQGITGGLTNCADIAKSLPNVGFYGTRDIIVLSEEWLLFQFFGATSQQNVAVAASVTVYKTAGAGGRVTSIE